MFEIIAGCICMAYRNYEIQISVWRCLNCITEVTVTDIWAPLMM